MATHAQTHAQTHTQAHTHIQRLMPAPITKAEILRLAERLRAEADRAESLQRKERKGSPVAQYYVGLRQGFGVASQCVEGLIGRPMQAPPLWHIDG